MDCPAVFVGEARDRTGMNWIYLSHPKPEKTLCRIFRQGAVTCNLAVCGDVHGASVVLPDEG